MRPGSVPRAAARSAKMNAAGQPDVKVSKSSSWPRLSGRSHACAIAAPSSERMLKSLSPTGSSARPYASQVASGKSKALRLSNIQRSPTGDRSTTATMKSRTLGSPRTRCRSSTTTDIEQSSSPAANHAASATGVCVSAAAAWYAASKPRSSPGAVCDNARAKPHAKLRSLACSSRTVNHTLATSFCNRYCDAATDFPYPAGATTRPMGRRVTRASSSITRGRGIGSNIACCEITAQGPRQMMP